MTAALMASDAFLHDHEFPTPALPAFPEDQNLPPCLAYAHWPLPKWAAKPRGGSNSVFLSYAACIAATQRSRYLELESDFLVTARFLASKSEFPKADVEHGAHLLEDARAMLDTRKPDPVLCSAALDALEHHLVWLLPPPQLAAKGATVKARLAVLPAPPQDLLKKLESDTLFQADGTMDEAKLSGGRGLLSEGIEIINTAARDQMVDAGHQAMRLRTWFWIAVVALILLVLAVPLMSDLSKQAGEIQSIGGIPISLFPSGVSDYVIVLTMALAGGIGGLVSGITEARAADDKNPATRAGNQRKLQLKPVMGAILALLLLIFTSWSVIEGVTISNLGMWYLLAFTAGFSERYFFKLLKLE